MRKTILITGATDGIGRLTAEQLARQGHRILLHGRSAAKLEAVQTAIGGDAACYQADLSSLEAVRDMAQQILAAHDQIDVLINNAGVLSHPNPITDLGIDVRFVVNTLAPYALTQALMPIIPATGRVLNLSSAAQAPVDIDAIRSGAPMQQMEAYAQSKRAITVWSVDLARSLPDGPTIIAVNPGSLLATNMVRDGFGIAGNDLSIGADILMQLALEPAHADDSGRYWDNDAGRFAPVDMSQSDQIMHTIRAMT